MHPVRTAKRKATPKSVESARRLLNPVDTAKYELERSIPTGRGRKSSSSPQASTGAAFKRNKYPDPCARCGKTVAAGEGLLGEPDGDGRWKVIHESDCGGNVRMIYNHDDCPVDHRTPSAAAACRQKHKRRR